MHAPVASQTFPVSQPMTPSSPKLVHWVGVLQQTAGLCFVQPANVAMTIKNLNMRIVSALRRPGCVTLSHSCVRRGDVRHFTRSTR